MTYREAQLDDLPQLLELEQCIIAAERPFNANIKSEKTSYYNIQHLIEDSDSCLMVAINDGHIIGTGYAQIQQSKTSLQHDRHSYLGFMFVSPEFRGQGINQKIIHLLVAWSQDRDVNDFYLDVYSQNGSAIKAYEKVGFQPCLMEMKLHLK